tara:strand:- start:209 stop:751 length:543 start_codon:yes stop_codon:yes gene_type:complete
MYFQNIEFYETDKFQYLLIHKNGSSSVKETIKYLEPTFSTELNFSKPRWTVIRDPYERFISGLKYDLKRHNLNIEDIDIKSLFNSRIHHHSRARGNVNHTASQVPYLINSHINYYVELTDLSTFLKMHFKNVEHKNMNKIDIKLNLDKEEIMKHLELDYYIYNSILNSSCLWKWQQGNIF